MQKQHGDNIQRRRNFQQLFVLAWVFWVLLLVLIGPSIVHDEIQTYISDPVMFRLRHALKKTPPLSNRLKVFALDDGTMSYLKQPELSTEDLALLIANIAKRNPKTILLDRLFTNAPPESDAAKSLEKLRIVRESSVPVYSGAWINGQAISYKKPHQLDPVNYGMKHWIEGHSSGTDSFVAENLQKAQGYIYAYDEAFQGSFAGVGHLRFDRVGSVFPLINYQDQFLLPHIALYAANKATIQDGLMINGYKVPLNNVGAVTVNHRPVSMFYENMKSLRFAIGRARNDQPETWVNEGDVVVILFNFFTGSTDFLEGAPFGNLPGGLLVSTLVDSILENRWLTPIGYLSGLIILMSVLGAAIGMRTGPIQFWGVILLVGGGYFIIVNYLFSYHGIVVGWVLPMAGLVGGGTVQYIYHRLGSEWKAIELQNQFLLERARRLEEEASKIQLAERLNLGRAVQEILLPDQDEQVFGPFRYSMNYLPAQEMSGDWVYLWGKGESERRVLLGDVVGKGPSAAIPVAVIIGILGECERLGMSMRETLQRLNQRISELFDGQITCSCAAIILHRQGHVELLNAGSPGWIIKEGAKSRHIPLRSTSLGMAGESVFASQTIELSESTLLFTFTDGYMEGGRALKRLLAAIDELSELPPLENLGGLLDRVGKEFRLEDDRSLLMIHAFGLATTPPVRKPTAS